MVLESCGVLALDSFLEALDLAVAILDPNATGALPIVVSSVDQPGGSVSWEADLGGDAAPELIGTLQFLDDQGQPAPPPFDLNQLLTQGLDPLDQLVTQLLDGWTVEIIAAAPLEPMLNAGFSFAFTGGAVTGVVGTGQLQSMTCVGLFDMPEAPLADLAPAFPTADMTASFTEMQTTVAGTCTFDGTNVAVVDVTVNGGGTVYSFAINLTTGTVTPVS